MANHKKKNESQLKNIIPWLSESKCVVIMNQNNLFSSSLVLLREIEMLFFFFLLMMRILIWNYEVPYLWNWYWIIKKLWIYGTFLLEISVIKLTWINIQSKNNFYAKKNTIIAQNKFAGFIFKINENNLFTFLFYFILFLIKINSKTFRINQNPFSSFLLIFLSSVCFLWAINANW